MKISKFLHSLFGAQNSFTAPQPVPHHVVTMPTKLNVPPPTCQWLHRLTTRTQPQQTVLPARTSASGAAVMTPTLSINDAMQVLSAVPEAHCDPQRLTLQQRAFARLYEFLQQHQVARQVDIAIPIITLVAARLSHLQNVRQREQAMTLLEQMLKTTPHLAMAEALTSQIGSLSAAMQTRALNAVADFLSRTAEIPQAHIDILVELTSLLQIPRCRQQANELIQRGLLQLQREPTLQLELQHRLAAIQSRHVIATAMQRSRQASQ